MSETLSVRTSLLAWQPAAGLLPPAAVRRGVRAALAALLVWLTLVPFWGNSLQRTWWRTRLTHWRWASPTQRATRRDVWPPRRSKLTTRVQTPRRQAQKRLPIRAPRLLRKVSVLRQFSLTELALAEPPQLEPFAKKLVSPPPPCSRLAVLFLTPQPSPTCVLPLRQPTTQTLAPMWKS